jgi:putative ABC transport system permease protein
MSYSVSSRRREMGIRLALGAHPRDLLKDVLESGLRLTQLGGAIGLAGAWVLWDALEIKFFQTAPHDGLTFVSSAILLLLTAFLACCLPRRRLDPIEALRE